MTEEKNQSHQISQQGKHNIIIGDTKGSVSINMRQTNDKSELIQALRQTYLTGLMSHVSNLALSGVDPKTVKQEKDTQIELNKVYTALLTITPEQIEDYNSLPEQEIKYLSALNQLNRYQHLVLLGDPGSGKSTFVNFVALCLSGELLDNKQNNLNLLQQPLPDDEGQDSDKIQTWDHGSLMPLRIILRDFVARGMPIELKEITTTHVCYFVAQELKKSELSEYAPYLWEEFRTTGGLVLFDGLDEVPNSDQYRNKIKQAIESFARDFAKCRILVTTRTYAYQKEDWKLKGFTEAVLTTFSKGQIINFVDRWYAHIAVLRHLNETDAKGRAVRLKHAIFQQQSLLDLASRPILLTLMASLHAWRGGSLPENREELYNDAVNLLLEWWEEPKIIIDDKGKEFIQSSLTNFANIKRDILRQCLNSIAFVVHAQQKTAFGTADISEEMLVMTILKFADNPDVAPKRLIEFLSHRTGIIVSRGNQIYTFPHRTFQEYLAACYLTDNNFPQQVAELAVTEPGRWREVVLLAGAKANRGSGFALWALVECLSMMKDHEQSRWGYHLAGQLLAETIHPRKVNDWDRHKLDRIRIYLSDLIRDNNFPTIERVYAGRHLALLGDPRIDVTKINQMQFCYVPGGKFLMGSDYTDAEKPEIWCEILDKPYWISRYLVTNAQYEQFIEAGGYDEENYWIEAKKHGIWINGMIEDGRGSGKRNRQKLHGQPYDLPNHPVVGVTWYESLAFCRWLNDYFKLPVGYEIKMPSEAEWEKAARGAQCVPLTPLYFTIQDIVSKPIPKIQMKEMNKEQLRWENFKKNRFNTNSANYEDTGIGTTNAVGCFPDGVTPFGCEEINGNAIEWTRSLYKDYPYDSKDDRESLDSAGIRVRRGGAFYTNEDYMRFTYRHTSRHQRNPSHQNDGLSFRVCFSKI